MPTRQSPNFMNFTRYSHPAHRKSLRVPGKFDETKGGAGVVMQATGFHSPPLTREILNWGIE
jgi:hypothetical protein